MNTVKDGDTIQEVIIQRTTASGSAVEIGVEVSGGSAWVYGNLDGRRLATVLGLGRLSKPVAGPRGMCTHHIDKIGVLAEEVPLIEAALEEGRRLSLVTPEGLRKQRVALLACIAGELDKVGFAREQAYNRDIGGIPSYDSPGYRTAKAALEEFDTRYPAVKASVGRAREERIKRAMWD